MSEKLAIMPSYNMCVWSCRSRRPWFGFPACVHIYLAVTYRIWVMFMWLSYAVKFSFQFMNTLGLEYLLLSAIPSQYIYMESHISRFPSSTYNMTHLKVRLWLWHTCWSYLLRFYLHHNINTLLARKHVGKLYKRRFPMRHHNCTYRWVPL